MIDELWVVTVPPEVACERVQKRNNLTREQAMARINSQLTNVVRESYGDVVIRCGVWLVTLFRSDDLVPIKNSRRQDSSLKRV